MASKAGGQKAWGRNEQGLLPRLDLPTCPERRCYDHTPPLFPKCLGEWMGDEWLDGGVDDSRRAVTSWQTRHNTRRHGGG